MLQSLDAGGINALATLGVHVLFQVAGQRGRNADFLPGKEAAQVFLARFAQYGKVATVNYRHAHGAGPGHHVAEIGIQFRCATGDIEGLNAIFPDKVQHQIHGFPVHLLSAGGPGIDVAVGTALVTAVAHVDLQDLQFDPGNHGEIGIEQQRSGI